MSAKRPRLDIEVQFDACMGEYNTLAVNAKGQFFLANGSDGEIDPESVKAISVQAGLEWFATTESYALKSSASVGSDGMPIRLCRAAAAIIGKGAA